MMRLKHIETVGVEVECGASLPKAKELRDKLYPDMDITTDGSVTVLNRLEDNWHHHLELKAHGTANQTFKFLKEVWAIGIKQNDTCGNHFHIKVKPKIEGMFSFRSFHSAHTRWYQTRYKDKAKYLNRMTNKYCKMQSYNEKEICDILLNGYTGSGERYRAVNLCSIRKHGTVEFRILPYMKNAKEHIGALKAHLRFIDKTIDDMLKKKVTLKFKKLDLQTSGMMLADLLSGTEIKKHNLKINHSVRRENLCVSL